MTAPRTRAKRRTKKRRPQYARLIAARAKARARARQTVDRWASVEWLILVDLLSRSLTQLRKAEKHSGKAL